MINIIIWIIIIWLMIGLAINAIVNGKLFDPTESDKQSFRELTYDLIMGPFGPIAILLSAWINKYKEEEN